MRAISVILFAVLSTVALSACSAPATKLDVANPSDVEILTEQNTRIGAAESAGDRDWLASVIAPELAFFRADGRTIDDADRFLQKVAATDPRTTRIESVEVLGNRAIVKCVVTVKSAAGDKRYHNLRLFIRYEGKWRMLGWANEEVH